MGSMLNFIALDLTTYVYMGSPKRLESCQCPHLGLENGYLLETRNCPIGAKFGRFRS